MYIASNGIKTAVILRDPEPESPREWDNITKMICWHRKYNLGDRHNFDDSQEFAANLAGNLLTSKDLFSIAHSGQVQCLRLQEVFEHKEINGQLIGPHYELQVLGRTLTGGVEYLSTGWRCTKDLEFITSGGESLEDFVDGLNTRNLLQILDASDKVAILPLYLYDHSGISMSTGSFIGRAPHAEWDSGCVGFIYLEKETAIKELAIASDKIRLAMAFTDYDFFKVPRTSKQTVADAMSAKGYAPVQKEDILNPESNIVYGYWIDNQMLFKKDHKLYVVDHADGSGTIDVRGPVASYNPNLERLTDENWKARALEVLEGDVKTYDNYLTGEVYGYETYNGLVQEDSCWGFNPGHEDVRSLMKDELRGWFGPGMEFKYELDDHFDIDVFYENHDFPQLLEKLTADVKEFVAFENSTSQIYPFAMPAEDIFANKDNVLEDIVEELYAEHSEYTSDDIYAAIQNHAGISRELQPKLSVSDLDPNKDYTQDELVAILSKKPSLADQISGAEARKAGKGGSHEKRTQEQEL